MKAKDTVMGEKEIVKKTHEKHDEDASGYCYRCVEMVAEAQAEISFKAGINEVVEWVKRDLIYVALDYDGTPSLHLQTNRHKSAAKFGAQLKEWGIE